MDVPSGNFVSDQNRVGWRRLIVCLACLPLLALIPLLVQANPSTPPSAELAVLASDEEGMLLELVVPRYTVHAVEVGGVSYQEVDAPGLTNQVALPGSPQLPTWNQLIALPPGAEAEIKILVAETETAPLSRPILPASSLSFSMDSTAAEHRSLAGVYLEDALYPYDLVTLGEPGYFRDQRVVRLEFNPLRVNPARDRLEHTRRLLVRVNFIGGDSTPAAAPAATSPAVENLLSSALLNYDQARAWRGLPAGWRILAPDLEIGIPAYKIEVDTDGIYQVTCADLLTAGMDVTNTNPLSLALTSQGQPVAIEWFGDEDTQFESGEGFYFYGQKFRGTVMEEKYTDVNVYWLTAQGPPGPRMSTVDGTPAGASAATSYRATIHQQQDRTWNPIRTLNLGDQDTWYWEWLVANPTHPVTKTQLVELTDLAGGDFTATVRVALFSEGKYYDSSEKHHAQVFFNDLLIDEQGQGGDWVGIQPRLFTNTVSQTDLLNGLNQMDWVLRGDVVFSVRKVYLNWFEVEYQRQLVAQDNTLAFGGDVDGTWSYTLTSFTTDTVGIWDVAFPLTPTRVLSPVVSGSGPFSVAFQASHPAGTQFIAVSADSIRTPLSIARYLPPDLDPPAGADWIAITHPGFITEVERLADYRAVQGLRTVVVDVDDLYNQYSDGIYQPAAIHDYLAHALTWPAPAPAYVLLVGDGHWNFKQVPGYAPDEPIYIPPYQGFLDPYQGEVPADNLYATLVGDDPMPDIALGRLPARSLTETAFLVDRIMAHEAGLLDPQDWQYNVVLLADDPDAGGDFHAQSDAVAALLPGYLNPVKVYYPISSTNPITQMAVDAFNAGATFYNYRGHGSLNYWAGSPILFDVNAIPHLTNTERLPVVLTMDCLDAYFAYPGNQAISEKLLRYSNGGSVGHWGSSGLGLSGDHSVLHESFYQRLFYDGATRLGMAVIAAKLDFSAGGTQQHNLHTFTLFGDPAMPLMAADLQLDKTAAPPGPYFPGDPITYTLAYSNTGLYWGYQAVITDLIPAELVSTTVHWAGPQITPTAGVSYSWTLEPIVPYAQGLITLSGRIDPHLEAAAALWFTNTAAIAAPALDWAPGNNQSAVSGLIVRQSLSLTKTAPLTLTAGTPLTYTLSVTNTGDVDLVDVWLADLIPPHATFASATTPYTYAGGIVTWTLPVLSPGDSASFQLIVSVDEGYSGNIVNETYHASAEGVGVVWGDPVVTEIIVPEMKVYLPLVVKG